MHDVRGDRIGAAALYALLRLRSQIFHVEQDCAYLDLDGRDLLPGTRHLWLADATPACALRILDPAAAGDDAWVIGRMVTRADRRAGGLGAGLMLAGIRRAGRPLVVNAQARLEAWYQRLDFVRERPDHVEDGIPHVRMRYRGGEPGRRQRR